MRLCGKALSATILGACSLFTLQTASASIIIDQFTIAQTVSIPPAALATGRALDSGADTFLGGDREVLIERSTGSANSVTIGSGRLDLDTTTTGRAEILYDGISADTILPSFNATPDSFGLALNLSLFDRFQVTAGTSNSAVPLTVILYNSGTKYLTGNITLNTSALTTQVSSTLLFSAFTATGDTAANILQNVGAIAILLNPAYTNTSGGDARLTSLSFLEAPPDPPTSTPEPATMSIVGLALLGGSSLIRKRHI